MENEDQGVPPIDTPTQGQPTNQNLQLADGTSTEISQDAESQIDAIDPYGQANISFNEGNYSAIINYPQKLSEKITMIQNTALPLIEKALIELLGNSSSYSRDSFMGAVTISGNSISISADVVYKSELFIGMDIQKEDIMHDSTYIFNTIKIVPGFQWRKCSIDTSTGEIKLAFIC